MSLLYLLISINPLFQILTYPLTHRKNAIAQHPGAPLSRLSCHPERRAKARSRTRRATVGRDLQSSSAPTPALHPRNGKTPGQHTPYPLFKSLLKGVRGKLFSRKVFPVLPQNFDNTLTGEVCCVIMYSCFERAEKRRKFYMIFRI